MRLVLQSLAESAFLLRRAETQEILDGCLWTLFLVPKEKKTFHLWRNRRVLAAIKIHELIM